MRKLVAFSTSVIMAAAGMISVVSVATVATVFLAPAAAAVCTQKSVEQIENGEAGAGCETEENKIVNIPKEKCADGSTACPKPIKEGDGSSWDKVTVTGGSRYFWEEPYCQNGSCFTYQTMYELQGCSAQGQKGFTDAPLGGTSYVIRASYYTTITNSFKETWIEGKIYLTETGPSVKHSGRCWDYNTPNETVTPLPTNGTWILNGPYQVTGLPMVSVDDGGTLTRKNKAGVITVQGDKSEGITGFGKSILSANGLSTTDPKPLRDGLKATPKLAYDEGIVGGKLAWDANGDPGMTSFGRYAILSQNWQNLAHTYRFTDYGQFVAEMFPAIYSELDVRFFPANGDLPPMFIKSVSGPNIVSTVIRYSVYCSVNADGGSRSTVDRKGVSVVDTIGDLSNALPVMPNFIMQQPAGYSWDDNENTYTFECKDGKIDTPTDVRMGDLLQCDIYSSLTTVPRRVIPVSTTWGVVSQYQVTVTDWCGYLPDAQGNPVVWCATHEETRYNYGWITAATPAGYTKDGSSWRENCPTGWDTDSPTQCSTKTLTGTVVDNKNAAPILSQTPDNIASRDRSSVTTNTFAFADAFQTVWDKVKISVNNGSEAGKNVNDLPASADVRWSRRWVLMPGSSPVLFESKTDKRVTFNSTNRNESPAHLFTDNTPLTDDDAPAESQKWLPLLDDGDDGGVFNRWVGLEDKGWENSQRAIWLRFFQAQNAGTQGWWLKPEWKATVTIPVNVNVINKVTTNSDGSISFTSDSVTENRRESMVCPGVILKVMTQKIVR